MKSDLKSTVSITKVDLNIENSVMNAIRLAGGLKPVVDRGDKIYLKPNFVAPRASSRGVTTDFEIIRVVAEEVRRCGGEPILFETPAIDFEKENVFEFLGVDKFLQDHDISLANGIDDLIKIQVPAGNVLKKIKIPRVLHNAKIINLPKLKTHVSAKMTCAMKNLIGLLPDTEKRRVHIRGVHESIADICRVFKPVFNIVDATTCMEGDGPTYGDEIDVGLVIAGKDMLAVDKVCSELIGLSWGKIKYMSLANDKRAKQNIEVAGESIEDIKLHFKIPEKSAAYHLTTRVMHIVDVAFSKVFSQHLNQFLFSTGYFGSNPKIIKEKCDECGDCVSVCPIENGLKIINHKVDYKKCIRCLDCYFACDKNAIVVKGFSRPDQH